MDLSPDLKNERRLGDHVPLLAIAFSLAVIPIIYTDVYLWARMGEFRLSATYLLVFITLVLTYSYQKPSAILVGLLLYQVFAKLTYFGSTESLTALNLSSVILLLTMFISGTAMSRESYTTSLGLRSLSILVFLLGIFIFKNSVTVFDDIQFIRGLNHRSDVTNFNYIFVAESFVTGSLILLCFGKLKTGSTTFLVWTLFSVTVLWCAGSRASLLLFLVVIATLHVIALNQRKLNIKNCFISVASLMLCLSGLAMISQPSVTVRLNPLNIASDTSFLERMKVTKRILSSGDYVAAEKNEIGRPLDRSAHGFHVNPTSLDIEKSQSLIQRVLSNVFGMHVLGLKSNQLYQHNGFSIYNYYGAPFFLMIVLLTAFMATNLSTESKVFPLYIYLCGAMLFRDDVNPLWWFVMGYIGTGFPLSYSTKTPIHID